MLRSWRGGWLWCCSSHAGSRTHSTIPFRVQNGTVCLNLSQGEGCSLGGNLHLPGSGSDQAALDQAAFLRRLPFVGGAAGWGSAWTGSAPRRCWPKPKRLASSERVAA